MGRYTTQNGVPYGYHDLLNDPDGIVVNERGHTDAKASAAMCMIIQSGIDSIGPAEGDIEDLEEFNINSFGMHIRINGQDFFLKAVQVASEADLYKDLGKT